MTESPAPSNAWRRFWHRGGWWRAALLVVVYYGLYQVGSFLFLPLLQVVQNDQALAILVGYGLPIAFGCVLIAVFALSTGMLSELFGPQPIRGRAWMWIAVAIPLLFNVLHFAAVDYAKAGPGITIAWIVSGVFIGLAEEMLTRGLVVDLMRRAGYREIAVALVSAALFAFLHSGNLLGGQALLATLVQLVYTFAFGICMYLALRVTGNLIWPVLLHATTDPSIFLLTSYPTASPLAALAGFGNPVVIVTGLVLLIFIRGRVDENTKIIDTLPA